MDPLYGEEKIPDGSKKMDPLSIYGEGTLLDSSRKWGLLLSLGEQKLLDSSSEKIDLLSTHGEGNLVDSSSDEDSSYGLRNMTRDELIKYITQVVQSEGFDVDPLPDGINMFGLLIPCELDEYSNYAEKIARFAIDHNNNTEGSPKLKLDRIIKYNKMARYPCKYYVTFTATDINTGGTHAYQAKVTASNEERWVDIFRRKYHQQFDKEEEIRFLTIFAINYHHRTTGQDLELVKGIVYDQQSDSCIITFKARDLSTCMVEIYETEVVSRDPIENSTVIFFIKNLDPSTYQEEKIRFLTIFAIKYHHRTTGQDLELVKRIVYDPRSDSCIITFKARDLSTCMVEIYQTEVVCRDPIENSAVIFFIKNPDPSTYQDLVPVVPDPSESVVAKIRQAWGNSGKDGARTLQP